jgi:hypothetical protein
MDDEIEVLLGEIAIGGVEALDEVLAGDDGAAHPLDRGEMMREGAGAAHPTGFAHGVEAVVEPAAGRQAGDEHAHDMAVFGAR